MVKYSSMPSSGSYDYHSAQHVVGDFLRAKVDHQPHVLVDPLLEKSGELVKSSEIENDLQSQKRALQHMVEFQGNLVFLHFLHHQYHQEKVLY